MESNKLTTLIYISYYFTPLFSYLNTPTFEKKIRISSMFKSVLTICSLPSLVAHARKERGRKRKKKKLWIEVENEVSPPPTLVKDIFENFSSIVT